MSHHTALQVQLFSVRSKVNGQTDRLTGSAGQLLIESLLRAF